MKHFRPPCTLRAARIAAALVLTAPLLLLACQGARAATYTVLYRFTGTTSDGSEPVAPLIQGVDGNFYGVTEAGGAAGAGTLFEMTPLGAVTILHSFGSAGDGQTPNCGLVQTSDGTIYGLTLLGGANSDGALFSYSTGGAYTVLHSFGAAGDGVDPSGLSIAAGVLYGATERGGSAGDGTLFTYTPGGAYAVLHQFGDGSVADDGALPGAAPVLGSDGYLYGTTVEGGSTVASDPQHHGYGVVYRVTTAGAVTILHSFGDGSVTSDGIAPWAGLVQGVDGNYYGVTTGGGSASAGTVFRVTPSGSVLVLHSFGDGSVAGDGQAPYGALILAPDGSFYGTTELGGAAASQGVVYRITQSGVMSILHEFGDGSVADDGSQPVSALLLSGGLLYGATYQGGQGSSQAGYGTLFSLPTAAVLSPVRFDFNSDGFSDLLWGNAATGQLLVWNMDGQTVQHFGTPFIDITDTDWQVVGMPDVNGDGKPDLLWWNSATGAILVWTMSGTTAEDYGSTIVSVAPATGWEPVAVADNVGSNWSLIWWNSKTGEVLRWLMTGTSVTQYGSDFAQVPDTTWHIVGAPDLEGAGHSDLLWENYQTGAVLYWAMDDQQVVMMRGAFADVPDTDWRIVGVPDVNGDGYPDLLWRNIRTGEVLVWLMDGVRIQTYGHDIAQVYDLDWSPVGMR